MICKKCGEYIPTNFEYKIIGLLAKGLPLRSDDIQEKLNRSRQQVDRALAILVGYGHINKTHTRPNYYYLKEKQ